jgi:ABC-2 type transport system ATP-binding protein
VFGFDGGTEELSDLLRDLVTAGVRVASFGRRKEDLEDVFLKVGAKEVS